MHTYMFFGRRIVIKLDMYVLVRGVYVTAGATAGSMSNERITLQQRVVLHTVYVPLEQQHIM